jgi:ubiquinone/menaquinone biosynthesis C-methylase UbiE
MLSRHVIVRWSLSRAELPVAARVLNVGGGVGAEAEVLAERHPGWTLTVTDIDASMVETANRRLSRYGSRVQVEVADVTALPFADASFHVVIALLVWHHVGEWRKATAEAYRVLRPEGTLMLADVLDPAFGALHRMFNQEGRTYTVGELRDCLSEAGFRHWRFRQCPGFVYRAIAKRSS